MTTNQYMNPNAKNITEAVNHIVAARVAEIKQLIGFGWTKAAAIEYVRETTTLGAKSWQQVMEAIA